MAEIVTIPGTYLFKRGEKDYLESLGDNLVPKLGEPVFETDTGKLKIGNGQSPYVGLSYVGTNEESLNALQEAFEILEERVNTFLADADLNQEAVDTLKEIQDLLKATDTNVADIVSKIAKFESLHTSIEEKISKVEEECKANEEEILEYIATTSQELNEKISNLEAEDKSIYKYIDSADSSLSADILAAKVILEGQDSELQRQIVAIQELNEIDHSELATDLDKVRADFETADKALSDEIQKLVNSDVDLATQITNEYTRASEEENAIKERIKAIEDDYLKTADKEEINISIGEVSNVANNAKDAIDAFLKEADATENAVNTLKEIQAELDAGEASAANLLSEINDLKAIDNATQEELNTAVASLENKISVKSDASVVEGIAGRVSTLENAGHVNATQLAAAKDEVQSNLNTEVARIDDKIDTYVSNINRDHKASLDNVIVEYKKADEAIYGRINELESKHDSGINEVKAYIDEKIGAIENGAY